MDKTQISAALVEVLRESGVFHLRDHDLENQFVAGVYDANLNELDIDSLAAMEICIALEANWGTALVPEDLHRLGTLQALVKTIADASL